MRSSGKGGKKVQMEQWLGQLETNTSETSERFHFIVLMGQNVIAKKLYNTHCNFSLFYHRLLLYSNSY